MHAYHKNPDFYQPIIAKIKKVSPLRLLDLGCGDGTFIKNIIEADVKGYFMGLDISSFMLQKAVNLLKDYQVDLITADGFGLPIKSDVKFDLIHLDSVLHHVIAKTRSQSRHLVNDLLGILFSRLSKNGFLMVEEMYYDSYIFPGFTSGIVFYGLKIANYLGLDLGKVIAHVVPGLEVNFYSINELLDTFSRHGDADVINKKPLKTNAAQRLFLQKDFGHVSFVIQKGTIT
jgi:SAM-dependent methyltransferase